LIKKKKIQLLNTHWELLFRMLVLKPQLQQQRFGGASPGDGEDSVLESDVSFSVNASRSAVISSSTVKSSTKKQKKKKKKNKKHLPQQSNDLEQPLLPPVRSASISVSQNIPAAATAATVQLEDPEAKHIPPSLMNVAMLPADARSRSQQNRQQHSLLSANGDGDLMGFGSLVNDDEMTQMYNAALNEINDDTLDF
jgi:hypothetical protein